MVMQEKEFRIGELAEMAGVSRRTVHYYTGRGLLPAPNGQGLGAMYGLEHLTRIRVIKQLQEQYVPLEEIKRRLVSLTLAQMEQLLTGKVNNEVKESRVRYEAAFGEEIRRIRLPYGVELHFPVGDERAEELARVLVERANLFGGRG
jgi:DNA-binding transcriptional MerR regulator